MPAHNPSTSSPPTAVPIPTRATATALGVPDERYRDFKRWADAEVAAIGRQLDRRGLA